MNLTNIKQAVCKFLFLVEAAALFILLSAAIQGSIALPAAVGYAIASFVGVNLLSCLILPTEEIQPSHRRTVAPAVRQPVSLRVVPGGRHAA